MNISFTSIFLSVLLFIVTYISTYSQEFIEADRPDNTEGTNFLSKNNLQIENGITFSDGETIENDLTIRYGILNNTEIRASVISSKKNTDMLSFSIKQSIYKGKKWIPAIALYGYTKYTAQDKWSTDAAVAFSHDISQKITLDHHFAVLDSFKKYSNSALISYQPAQRWTMFVEYFIYYSSNTAPEHNADIGIGYKATKGLQIDAIIGNKKFRFDFKTSFIGLGASFLIR